MYLKQSVYRPEGNAGIGILPKDAVVLVDVDDIAVFPSRDDKGVVIVDDIVMKQGRYGIAVYMTPGTPELASAADGETDQVGYTPSIKFNHPGNEQEIREFKANWINRKFVAIVRYCSGKPADLIGSPCNPCKLTPSYTGNNSGNTNEITIQQTNKGEDIAIYRGNIPLEEPVTAIPASATSFAYVADGTYQATAGEAEITKITGGHNGALITILGCAGSSVPTIAMGEDASSDNILLANGTSFSASEGCQLTLRAFSVGGNKLVWIEQSRHEV